LAAVWVKRFETLLIWCQWLQAWAEAAIHAARKQRVQVSIRHAWIDVLAN
jgi:hypothetical protein